MNRRYILDGHTPVPCPKPLEWASYFAARDAGQHSVARTLLDEAEIITEFIGLDHNRSGHGPPLLFETAILGGPLDGTVERYATWADAEAGHDALVQRCREALRWEQEAQGGG